MKKDTIREHAVLIAGTGRSGTTWLGKIVDSSPHVFYKHEPDNQDMYPWFRDIPTKIKINEANEEYASIFKKALEETFPAYSHDMHHTPDFPKKFIRRIPWFFMRNMIRIVRKVRRINDPICSIPGWVFIDQDTDFHYIIKSVTSNFRLAFLHKHIRQMKFILLIRHPGGYLNSWLNGVKKHGWSGFGTKERLSETVLPFVRPEHSKYTDTFNNGTEFERELIYWFVANESPILDIGPSSSLKTVVYEELCKGPLKEANDIFDFIGIPFCSQAENFVKESTSQHRTGFYDVYKDPLIVANRWQKDLDTKQIDMIYNYLDDSIFKGWWGKPERL